MTNSCRKLLAITWTVVLGAAVLYGQGAPAAINTDVLGKHDMSGAGSPVHGGNANACIYCHAPHSGLSSTPLWNQTLSTKQYSLYPGTTDNPNGSSTVGTASLLCLSCHDGSVAVGRTVAIGTLQMLGAVNTQGILNDNLGTSLEGSHPFSLRPGIVQSSTLVESLASSHKTADPAVSLIKGNIECNTCHNVHNEFTDRRERKFLVRDNTGSALCFACHDTVDRNVQGRQNSLVGYQNSAHQSVSTANLSVAAKAGLGGYDKVYEFACLSCHTTHGGRGMGLLRVNANTPSKADDTAQTCFICHDNNDNLEKPISNIQAEFNGAGQISHPFSDTNNPHTLNEPVVVNGSRHATCADCHNSHKAQKTTTFAVDGSARPAQIGVPGVAADGTTKSSASFQYETCLRCHSTSDKKQSLASYGYLPFRSLFSGDLLDVSLQFGHNAPSSHAVMRTATAAQLAIPSLRQYVYRVDWQQGRSMSANMYCTDCHNNDDNREFGGNSPNGPHGSKNDHILERKYLMTKVPDGANAGTSVETLYKPAILEPVSGSQYALCAKCHDLKIVDSTASWHGHQTHIEYGFSCSVCHSGHGVQAGTTGVSGTGMISFDLKVVGKFNNQPISYDGRSCTLTCHNKDHHNTKPK